MKAMTIPRFGEPAAFESRAPDRADAGHGTGEIVLCFAGE